MLSNLVGILLRFRQMPVALSADIEDMFLQVKVPEADQDALRFLWWPNGDLNSAPAEFRLTVHPFGAVSSPFCANFALRKAATLFGHEFPPTVSQVILENVYVDDCLVSVKSKSTAIALVKGLTSLFNHVGFRLPSG
ncbi:reverse transcriptase domain-containing protein [Streptococcus dysgalactiae]|uniref:reverse transcriptase domain-containing protein n=1 Tax=Streptococcus dysgalactiae TaxID=1334 RepID=UPI00194FE683|nr:reverse transcriptase domain-containing protein [Streptococcus dysgalactiae]MBM6549384.1 hypothetical protein [Streptococcus dysgalactiae subsp. equisimilis]